MPISDRDVKMLWGRAAGKCSQCHGDLTPTLSSGSKSLIGEMAHVVARRKNGPRGSEDFPAHLLDTYANLILLCPNHHTQIDDAPQDFTVNQILARKETHEAWVQSSLLGRRFATALELANEVQHLLLANQAIFDLAQESALRRPLGTAGSLWELRKAAIVIPNNRQICALVDVNQQLFSADQLTVYFAFREHAADLEHSTFRGTERNPSALFPRDFSAMIAAILSETI